MTRAPRDLRLLAGAVLLSAAGDMLLVVVLALRVHDLTGSGFAVAALFARADGADRRARAARRPARGPHRDAAAAAASSRSRRRRSRARSCSPTGSAPILVLTALLGAGAAIAGPAEAALVPAAVAGGRLTQANGWVETARYAGFTAGPLLAGVLTAAGGTQLGLAANAVSFWPRSRSRARR